jgi:hypothetical protein
MQLPGDELEAPSLNSISVSPDNIRYWLQFIGIVIPSSVVVLGDGDFYG